MRETLWIRYGKGKVPVEVPSENFLYFIKPGSSPQSIPEKEAILASLRNPIASPPLVEQLRKGMRIVIVGDDLTRATPRERIFPVLLDELNGILQVVPL